MDMQRFYIFGDSISKGVILDEARKRYSLLSDNFISLTAERLKLSVKNYSRMGCTVDKGSEIIAQHLGEVGGACAVFEFGGNDCDYDWNAIAADPEAKYEPKTTSEAFVGMYKNMLNEARDAGAKPVIINLPPLDADKYFAWFSREMNETEKQNVLKWLGGSAQYIYRWHEMYDMQLCNLAKAENVPLVDIRSAFLQKRDYTTLLCADGIHPNEAGHALIAETIKSIF